MATEITTRACMMPYNARNRDASSVGTQRPSAGQVQARETNRRANTPSGDPSSTGRRHSVFAACPAAARRQWAALPFGNADMMVAGCR